MTRNKRLHFYVYLIRDPRADKHGVPIYVGKGNVRNGRAKTHWRAGGEHYNPLMARFNVKCQKFDLVPTIEYIEYFDSEDDAFRLEIELIAKYGRRDHGTGTLYNLTNGGEGTSGLIMSAEYLELLRKRTRKMNADPEFAKRRDERTRKMHTDPEFAKRRDERTRMMHADPEFAKARDDRAHMMHADPEFAKANAERVRKMNADPEFAKARDERTRKMHADPEFAKAQAERARECMRKLHADPEFAKRRDERMRKIHADRARWPVNVC